MQNKEISNELPQFVNFFDSLYRVLFLGRSVIFRSSHKGIGLGVDFQTFGPGFFTPLFKIALNDILTIECQYICLLIFFYLFLDSNNNGVDFFAEQQTL